MRLLAVLCVLLIGGTASATQRRACVVYAQPVVAVKEEKIVYVPAPVLYYSISYQAPPQYQAPPAPQVQAPPAPQKASSLTDEDMLLLVQSVRQLNTRLSALEAKLGQAQAPQLRTYEDVVNFRCATCHSAGVSAKKGGRLTLIDEEGRPAPLSLVQQDKVVKKMESGDMPPGDHPKATAAEIAIVKARFEKGI